jgi:molecular chaperone HscB
VNHFELFGLAPSVDIDVKALEQQHRDRAMTAHPDRLIGADAHTRRQAAELSASLNEAVRVLRDPLKRALYVLKLAGVDLEGERAPAMPLEFLEEVIEQREALEQARATKDLERAVTMAKTVRAARDLALAAAQAALREGQVPLATVALGRVRYYSRFLEEVDAFEEELTS